MAHGTPPGSGALFKCAICGDLVYETQLDFHVSICPDIGKLGDTASSAGTSPGGAYSGSSEVTLSLDLQQPLEVLYEAPEALGEAAEEDEEEEEDEPEASADIAPAAKDASEPLQRSESMPPLGVSRREFKGKGEGLHSWLREAEDRGKRRRQHTEDEIPRREADECTFTPRVLTRRSNSSGARMRTLPYAGPGAAEEESIQQQRHLRQKRLERVEAELYSHVTLHPKISPFARAWGAREKEALEAMADREGKPAPSVFERLYAIAMQERRAREAREVRELREVSGNTTDAVGASARSMGDSLSEQGLSASQDALPSQQIRKSGSASSRSRLLYVDALDRQQRQRRLEAVEQREAERRAASQVLARSRRYYWQMLERQIKKAFDAACSASGDEAHLTFARLEDFLRHFGCLKVPKASTPMALERSAEDSRKLRVALWKHLDPHQIGYVDFLTLTVFFHVLMGAVDEEAQCLHNLSTAHQMQNFQQSAGSTNAESSVAAAAAAALAGGAAGSQSDRPLLSYGSPEAGSSSCGLGAIYEEGIDIGAQVVSDADTDDLCSPTTPLQVGLRSELGDSPGISPRGYSPGRAPDAVSAASAAVASADPEGPRICELLMRFDPKLLRAEFKQLYLDRLHGQNAPASAVGDDSVALTQQVQAPELNSRSLALAERVVQRQRDDAGGQLSSHAELLHWRLAQSEAKKSAQRARREVEEVQGCTFHPSLRTARRSASVERIPSTLPPHARLYANASRRQQEREAKAAMLEHRRSEREREACTFRPDTSKSGRSYQRHGSASSPAMGGHPRGYDQCKQRMRRAFAGHVQKKRLLEERFLPIDAASMAEPEVQDRRPQSARTSTGSVLQEVELPSAAMLLPAPTLQPQTAPAMTSPSGAAASAPAPAAPCTTGTPAAATVSTSSPSSRRVAASPRGARAPTGRVRGQQKPPQGAGRDVPRVGARPRSGGPSKGVVSASANGTAGPAASAAVSAAMAAAMAGGMATAPAVSSTSPTSGVPPAKAHQKGGASSPTYATNTGSGGNAEVQYSNVVQSEATPGKVVEKNESCTNREGKFASEADEPSNPPPIVYVEVNIAPGRPPEKLVLREGQSPAEAAAEFAVLHRLSPNLAQRLHLLLKELMNKPDLGAR